MIRLARLACLLGAFAFAGPTFAQNIDTALPAHAAVGTTLEITGSGFGIKKPKVQLFDSATNKKYTLKVVDSTDSVIHATISKGVVGDLTLQVLVKGVPTIEAPMPITIERPLVTSLSAASADPNAPLTIFGDFFGTKKGKIKIGNATAKVVSWINNEIHVLMPKKLFNGFHAILVDNKLGTDDDATVQMVNSTVKIGKATLNAFINGSKLKVKYGAGAAPGGYAVVAFGTSGTNPSKSFVVAVPFLDGHAVPEDYVFGTDLFVVSYIESSFGKGGVSFKAFVPTIGFTVNITANSAGQVAGNFSGTLANQSNAGETLTCSGDFVVDVISP